MVLLPWSTVRVFYFAFLRVGTWSCSGFFLIGFWVAEQVVLQLVVGKDGGVAYAAHLGGFFAGLGAGFLLDRLLGLSKPARAQTRPRPVGRPVASFHVVGVRR